MCIDGTHVRILAPSTDKNVPMLTGKACNLYTYILCLLLIVRGGGTLQSFLILFYALQISALHPDTFLHLSLTSAVVLLKFPKVFTFSAKLLQIACSFWFVIVLKNLISRTGLAFTSLWITFTSIMLKFWLPALSPCLHRNALWVTKWLLSGKLS